MAIGRALGRIDIESVFIAVTVHGVGGAVVIRTGLEAVQAIASPGLGGLVVVMVGADEQHLDQVMSDALEVVRLAMRLHREVVIADGILVQIDAEVPVAHAIVGASLLRRRPQAASSTQRRIPARPGRGDMVMPGLYRRRV